MKKEPEALDCEKLAKIETDITLDGRQIMQVVNGLNLLHQAQKHPDIPSCEECKQATDETYDMFSDLLDGAQEAAESQS